MVIKREYARLLNLIHKCEFRSYSITQAFKDINELDFGNDSCKLKDYIRKRLDKNQLKEIVEMKDTQVSPSILACCTNALPQMLKLSEVF